MSFTFKLAIKNRKIGLGQKLKKVSMQNDVFYMTQSKAGLLYDVIVIARPYRYILEKLLIIDISILLNIHSPHPHENIE